MSERTSGRKNQAGGPLPPTWDEKLIRALRPWGWEIGGVMLFIVSALTLFGLMDLITIGLVRLWSNLWWLWWGWVAFVANLFLGGLALHWATGRMTGRRHIGGNSTQWLGAGLLIVTLLPFSWLVIRPSLAASLLGLGGGRLAWSLTQPLVYYFGDTTAVLFYAAVAGYGVCLITGYGWADFVHTVRRLSRRFYRWSREVGPVDDPRPPRPAIAAKRRRPSRADRAPAVPPPSRLPDPPPLTLLHEGEPQQIPPGEIAEKREIIAQTLADFRIPAEVLADPLIGPAITRFAVVPGYTERELPDGSIHRSKVRISKIANLHRDLALSLAAPRIRIQAPVPGQGIVGVEVPNNEISTVRLREVIESEAFMRVRGRLAFAVGKDVAGEPVAADISKLPHMLVAGQTGAGKSVFINALIACLVMTHPPERLKMVMIDPKKVELIRFGKLPHLLGPVEVDGERAIGVLRWLTAAMDDRYEQLAAVGARNIGAYNEKMRLRPDGKQMPYIVAFIDELADLMVQYGGDVEGALCRLAQMARATGIHLIVATQRPSTDVITGLIKANFPARASFAVASNTDSRVILDSGGAENLLGQGDMLFLGSDASNPRRIQGCFVSDEEVEAVVDYWVETVGRGPRTGPWEGLIERIAFKDETDELIDRAVALAQKHDNLSTSLLQRKLRVGYPRAADIMETLYEMGMVADPQTGGRPRESLVDDDEDALSKFLEKHGEDYIDYPDKPDFDNL